MKLAMNGHEYDVPQPYLEKLMADVLAEGAKDYQEKLGPKTRVTAMGGARVILAVMESHVAKESEARLVRQGMEGRAARKAAQEEAAAMKPGKTDPVMHLGWVFSRVVLEGLKHVSLHIDTDGAGTVSAFGLVVEGQSEAGRLVGLDRGAGVGQVNGAEVS